MIAHSLDRSTPAQDKSPGCDPAARVTRSLLGYGVLAGPFYVVLVLAQSLLRSGFDLAHDDASLLSNGAWGWVQRVNFGLTGLMVIACAVGVGRALSGGRAANWVPRMLGVYGVGLISAGIFSADPMNGFPAGAPEGRPESVSVEGTLHLISAGIGFLGLILATFLLFRYFAKIDRRGWSNASALTGFLFIMGFAGLASGSSSAAVVLGFWAALVIAWGWLAAVSIHLYRRLGATS